MPPYAERRMAPRLKARPNRSALFVSRPMEGRRVRATLIDISREGAQICADEGPGLFERGLIRMEEPVKSDWVAAVGVRHGESGRVGLRFVDQCPDDFLLAALLGIDLGPTLLGAPRPETVDDIGV